MQAFGVVPIDPFQRLPFDLGHGFPGAEEVESLGFEQANDAFGQGVVVGIPDGANGRVDASFAQAVGVFDRQVLRSAVRMMD